MSYKILDLYRDLPHTNCGECGSATCFAFAGAVFLEGAALDSCPHLAPPAILQIQGKMLAGQPGTGDTCSRPGADAIAALRGELASRDLDELARNTGATLSADSGRTLCLDYFGRPCVAIGEGDTPGDDSLGTRAMFIVLDHLVRSRGTMPAGKWSLLFELPIAASLTKAVYPGVARLGPAFAGRVDQLELAASILHAREGVRGSATACHVFTALPRVELLLKFWDGEEDTEGRANVLHPEYGRFTSTADFDARTELRVDKGVLDQLSPEAICYLIGELTDRLIGPLAGNQGPVRPAGAR